MITNSIKAMSRQLEPFITSEYSFNSHDLLLKLKRRGPPRHREHSKRMIIEKLNEDADCEIATTSLCISLMCPLARKRMTHPCRARTCEHLQCFDTLFYLQMNQCKPTWNCPVCDKPAPYEDLYIDGYFLEVLYSPLIGSETVEIQLHKDGSWSTHNDISRVVPLDDCIEIISDDCKSKPIVVEAASPPVIVKDEDKGVRKLKPKPDLPITSEISSISSSSDDSSSDSSSLSSTTSTSSSSSTSSLKNNAKEVEASSSIDVTSIKPSATWRPFEIPNPTSLSSSGIDSLRTFEATWRPFASQNPFSSLSYGINSLTPFEATWGLQEVVRRPFEIPPSKERGIVDLTLMEDDEPLAKDPDLTTESPGEIPPLSLLHLDAIKHINAAMHQVQQAGVVDLTLLNDDEPQRHSTVDLTIEPLGLEPNPEVAKEKCVVDLTELNDDECPVKRRRLTQTVDLTSDTTSVASGSNQSWKLSIPGFVLDKSKEVESTSLNANEGDVNKSYIEAPSISKEESDDKPKEVKAKSLCMRDILGEVEVASPPVKENNDLTLLNYIRDELKLELTTMSPVPINTENAKGRDPPVKEKEDESIKHIQPDLTIPSSDPFWMSCDPWREYVGGQPRTASAMDCSCGPNHQPETEGEIRASMLSYLFFR